MILVTGGTGFIGPHVVHALRAAGEDVRVLARKPGGKGARRVTNWGVEVVPGDMTDAESLRSAVEGCDTVVHLVAIPTGSEERFERVMTRGTRDLVEAAKNAGVTKFVHMSALGTSPASKDVTPYFRAKWNQEQTVKASGIDHVVFRASFVFGPDGGMLPLLVKQVRWAPVVAVVGTRRMQPVWVEDVAAAFASAATSDAGSGRTFDLVGPDAVTWDELYDRIKRTLGKRRPTFHPPMGLVRAGAAVLEKIPTGIPLSPDGLTMLEFADNVGDPAPLADAFGIRPVGLNEQIRRAVSA